MTSINTTKFHEDNEKFVKLTNQIIQTVKGNDFSTDQHDDTITAGTALIDALGNMREQVYALTESFTYNPAAYDDTDAVNQVAFEEVGEDIDALQIKLTEQVALMADALTAQSVKNIIYDKTYAKMTKNGTYTTAETAALAAVADLAEALVVV